MTNDIDKPIYRSGLNEFSSNIADPVCFIWYIIQFIPFISCFVAAAEICAAAQILPRDPLKFYFVVTLGAV